MSTETIGSLDVTVSAPANADLIGVWTVAGQYGKATRLAVVGGTLTGEGTIATGGFTLTIPATGIAALIARANVFTTTQSITPGSISDAGLAINMPASAAASAFGVNYNGGARMVATAQATVNSLILADANLGDNNLGSGLYLGRNTAGGQPAGGFVRFTTLADDPIYQWIDAGGHMRINDTAPDYANDEVGEIVLTDANFAVQNVFTTLQKFEPDSTITGAISISMPVSTGANAIVVNYIAARFFLVQRATISQLIMADADLGADAPAPGLYLGRNTNGTTPTSGFIRFTAKNGVDYYVWVGSDGKLHINSSVPTNAIDTSATVVGAQS